MNVPNPTLLVQRIERLDDQASNELLPLIYDQLRKLAASYLRRNPAAKSIQPTDLVHEAFAQLIDRSISKTKDRAKFFAVAAHAMRTIMVDRARQRLAEKRGGGWQRITLGENAAVAGQVEFDVLALHEALQNLSKNDERAGQVVELRYFGGLTIAETAEVLQTSHTTVKDEWRFAKAWLGKELSRDNAVHDEETL